MKKQIPPDNRIDQRTAEWRAEDVYTQNRGLWVRLHEKGGTLERAAQMANHASTRTTQLYDHRAAEVTLDEVEW